LDDSTSTRSNVDVFTTRYVRKLLIERHHIYAKLTNPGGSVILRASALVDVDRPLGYSSDIGNDFHLDMIALEELFDNLVDDKILTKKEIINLLVMLDGLDSRQAAHFLDAKGSVSVRKIRERGVRKLTDGLNERERNGGNRHRDASRRRTQKQDDPVQGRDTGRAASDVDTQTGDSHE
jgi:hypothetical protein